MALKVVKHDFTEEEMATVSLLAQMVKDLPAMQETQVPSLGQKDPLETGFQYCCLEDFMDRGAWQDTIHGVTKS